MFPCQTESQAITQERWGVASNFRSSRIEPLPQIKFKMLTIKMIVSPIQSGDWFVTIYLKDAYFHVEILPQHRKFLRFAFGSLSVSGSSIQPSFVTPHVYEMHGCSTVSSETPGHPHFKLHKRLDDSGHSLKSFDIEMST